MAGDVVDLIMQDHRELERLFEQLQARPDQRPMLLPVLTTLLTAHSRAEEAEVYPAARAEADETEEVAHSQQEHALADKLLKQLAATDPASLSFDQTLAKLVEAVTHHVAEEESTVLRGMTKRLSEQRRGELGAAFARSRAEHLGEQPGEMTREQLATQARNVGLAGTSAMTKEELARQMSRRATS